MKTLFDHFPHDVWMALGVAAVVIMAWKFLTGTLKFFSHIVLLSALIYAAYRLFYTH